jgi:MFS family permease
MAGFSYLMYGLGFITPYVQHDLGVPEAIAALPSSIGAVGLGLSGLFASGLAGRVGSRTAGRFWLLVMAGAGAALATRASLPVVLSAAFVFGLAAGGLLVLVNSSLGHGGDGDADTRLVRANLWAMVGAVVAPLVLAAAASTAGLGWAAGLLAPIPLLIAVAVLLPAVPVRDAPAIAGVGAARLPPRYWLAWLFIVAGVGMEYSFVVWGPSVVVARTGLPTTDATRLASLFVSGMLIGRLTLSTGFGSGERSRAILRLCLGLAAAGAAVTWLAPNVLAAGFGLFLGGMGVAAIYPLGVGLALQQAPGSPVHAASRLTLASGLAILAAPLILGVVAQLVGVVAGWPLVFLFAAAAFAILAKLPALPPVVSPVPE